MTSVSVIVPVYNTEVGLLQKCFDSLSAQSLDSAEFVVVDDGSNQGTADDCDRLAACDSRFKVIHQQNQGLAGARNTGLAAATGDYIVFVDSDDYIVGDSCLADVLDHMRSHDLDLVLHKIDARSNKNEFDISKGQGNDDVCLSIITQNDCYGNLYLGSAWSKMFRRSFLRDHGIEFDPRLRRTQDRLFMLVVFSNDPAYEIIDYVGYHYNVDNMDSLTHKYNPKNTDYLSLYMSEVQRFTDSFYAGDERFVKASKVLKASIFYQICSLDFFHPLNANSEGSKFRSYKSFVRGYVTTPGLLGTYSPTRIKRMLGFFPDHHLHLLSYVLLKAAFHVFYRGRQ